MSRTYPTCLFPSSSLLVLVTNLSHLFSYALYITPSLSDIWSTLTLNHYCLLYSNVYLVHLNIEAKIETRHGIWKEVTKKYIELNCKEGGTQEINLDKTQIIRRYYSQTTDNGKNLVENRGQILQES